MANTGNTNALLLIEYENSFIHIVEKCVKI